MNSKLVVRPSAWKLLFYAEIGMVFVVSGGGMLLLPASQINPTPLNPEPPAVVRVYGIVAAALGLIAVYMVVHLASRTVLDIGPSEVRYPRERYTVSVADIKSVECYRYYMLRGMPARMIAVRLKNPEKYSHVAPKISRWGAEMLGADLYWNLGVASNGSFEKVCEALGDAGVPVTYAVYERHGLRESRKEWGDLFGLVIWLSERVPIEVDVAVFTAMAAAFAWLVWRGL